MQDSLTDWNAVDGSAGQVSHPNLDDTVYVLVEDPYYNVHIAVPGRVMALLAGQAQIRVVIRTPDGKSFEPAIITYSRSELFPSMESCLKHQLYQSMAFSCMYAAELMDVVLSIGPREDKEIPHDPEPVPCYIPDKHDEPQPCIRKDGNCDKCPRDIALRKELNDLVERNKEHIERSGIEGGKHA